MAKKYYAVAKGKTPGIYFTWEDCKAQIEHVSGAVYKSFPSVSEAEAFIEMVNGTETGHSFENENALENVIKKSKLTAKETESPIKETESSVQETESPEKEAGIVSSKEHLVAYVDGSYDHSKRRYAFGCAMILEDEVVTLNGSGDDEDYVGMRNVAGEILGSEQAILWAEEHGYSAVTIYYDYEGIEKWANGIWKANKEGTKRYRAFVAEQRKKMDISFRKVAAHTGVEYNELADQLAKKALGIE